MDVNGSTVCKDYIHNIMNNAPPVCKSFSVTSLEEITELKVKYMYILIKCEKPFLILFYLLYWP